MVGTARIVVRYNGKIESAGTPFEICNFPQKAFVGTLNTFSSEVIDPASHT